MVNAELTHPDVAQCAIIVDERDALRTTLDDLSVEELQLQRDRFHAAQSGRCRRLVGSAAASIFSLSHRSGGSASDRNFNVDSLKLATAKLNHSRLKAAESPMSAQYPMKPNCLASRGNL